MTAMSSGARSPEPRIASIAPAAISSFMQKTALGRLPDMSRSRIAATPPA